MPLHRDNPRVATACCNCRERKVKCSGGSPCKDCYRQRKECIYPPLQRKRRLKDAQGTTIPNIAGIEPSRMEPLIRTTTMGERADIFCRPTQFGQIGTRQEHTPSFTRPGAKNAGSRQTMNSIALIANLPSVPRHAETTVNPESPQSLSSRYEPPGGTSSRGPQSFAPYPTPSVTQTIEPDDFRNVLAHDAVDREVSAPLFQQIIWEHHDPWPSISVCSPTGLKWVAETTGRNDFSESVVCSTNGWSQRVNMMRDQAASSTDHEIDENLAWKYVSAYFSHSNHAVFGILDRPAFESRLKDHFYNGSVKGEDASWRALRNVVYATGCRCLLAGDSAVSYVDAQAQAWHYFNKALSVFTELLLGPTSFSAVQALTLMTFYAEGLGSAALENVLCSNAVRMAQAKGLHRQPPKSHGLLELDVLKRNWLWWVVYCLEKQIAFRSGRPSAIVDDDISTQIPTVAAPGSPLDAELFTFIIRHAQISSQISRRVMSVKASRQSPIELVKTVTDLHNQLQQLIDSMPPSLKINTPVRSSQNFQSSPRLIYIVYLHFAIYGSLMAIHVLFFYPWISNPLHANATSEFQSQVESSSNAIADAARKIIHVIRIITVDVTSPAWLAFYYPMYAQKNLFVHILRSPTLPTARGDVVLLDVCAGHFGNTEFVTSSEMSFTLPRDSATIASNAVKAAKAKENKVGNRATATRARNKDSDFTTNISRDNGLAGADNGASAGNGEQAFYLPYETNPDDVIFDMEPWNIHSSGDIPDDSMLTSQAFQR